MPGTAIEVRGLTKSYGATQAVRGIDLVVDEGEIFALLGPNGAGKTTTVEILEGFRGRDGGEVRVLGHDPASGSATLKAQIGIVLQDTGVERFLTVSEVVEMYSRYYPKPLPVDEVLSLVGLADKRDQRVYKLSGGQMRRLDVAVGLAGDPDLLFLDEPTTGFDPNARRAAWEMIAGLKGLGKTVFLTTHYMEEAQFLADRVAIIVEGQIVAEGPPADLAGGEPTTRITFTLTDRTSLPPELHASVEPDGRVTIETGDPVPALNRLTSWAIETGSQLDGLSVTRASLEEIYLDLTRDRVS